MLREHQEIAAREVRGQRTRDDDVRKTRLESTPPFSECTGVVWADVRYRVHDEPPLGALVQGLDEECERREEATREDWECEAKDMSANKQVESDCKVCIL